MAKYDVETLINEVKNILINNLSNKIDEVTLDKNDGMVLAKVDPAAYYIQQINDGPEANLDPIIVIGEDDVNSSSNGPGVSKTHSISAIIMVEDSGQDLQLGNRMFRYRRCLEEIFEKNWASLGNGNKLEIKSLVPVPLTNLKTGQPSRAVGVSITATLVS